MKEMRHRKGEEERERDETVEEDTENVFGNRKDWP